MAANTGPSFSSGEGRLSTDFGGANDQGNSVVLQSDGKILVAGQTQIGSSLDFALVRYNANGTLDTSFDGDGRVTTAFSGEDAARVVLVQSDGKIVVAGTAEVGSQSVFALARYNSDGSLDTTFDGDGRLTTQFTSGRNQLRSAVLQPDGKLVVAGFTDNGGNGGFALARYNANGSLDTTFDGDGKVVTDVTAGFDSASAMTLQPDGKILVGGPVSGGAVFVRYNTNGSFDTSFVVSVGPNTQPAGIIVQPDGTIVFATSDGQAGSNFTAVHRNADGSANTSWNGSDRVVTDIGGLDLPRSIASAGGGKFVLAGVSLTSANHIAVARYNANGTLDTTFDSDGIATTSIGTQTDANSVAIQADGKTVVAGWTTGNGGDDFALVRYNMDGTLDRTFGPPTDTLGGIARYASGGPPVVLDGDVHVLDVEFAAQGHYAGASLRLARHDGADAHDAYSATGALGALTQGAPLLYSGVTVGTVTTNSDGVLLLTFNSNATQARVDGVLQSIAYSNTGPVSEAIRIDWNFSDGNAGAQGTGGPLTAVGSTTVGGPGFVTTPILQHEDFSARSALQADGKIVVVGFSQSQTSTDFSIVRYNPNGSLDATFGNDGKVTTDIAARDDGAHGVAVQSDGKIVVAGYSRDVMFNTFFALARYNADGTLDTSFGGDGKVTTDIGGGASGQDVLVQPDGRIVVAGYSFGGANNVIALARYNSDGSLDTAFDGDGIVTTASFFAGEGLVARSVVARSDGKLIVAGQTSPASDFLYAAYNADGSLDRSADPDGYSWALFGAPSSAYSITLRPDGKFLLAGEVLAGGGRDFAVAQFNANLTPDTAFGTNGKVTTAIGSGDDLGRSIALQSDGKFVVGGTSPGDFALARYNADGTLDTSFGGDGTVSTSVSAFSDVGSNVLVQADGRIVITGASSNGNNMDFAAVRYNADGTLDATFGGGAPVELWWSSLANGAVVDDFNPVTDVLRFDDGAISAAEVSVSSGSTVLSHGGKTVTLDVSLAALSSSSIRFEDASRLLVGDNTPATGQDDADNTFAGGPGNDQLLGLGGDDGLFGSGGADALRGGEGNDRLYGGVGADVLDGGSGADYARYDTAPAGVRVDLGGHLSGTGDAAGDTFISIENVVGSPFVDAIHGNAGINTLQGRDGVDSLYGKDGADTLQGGAGGDNLYGDAGADVLDGGADFDWARYDTALAAVTADLSGVVAGAGDAAGDTFTLVERLVGSGFDDRLFGDALANTLQGRDGADTLVGRGGKDTLQGGNGNDDLDGGAGQDLLLGDAGNDKFRFKVGEANGDRVQDFNGNGVLAGDELVFQGYGLGATFIQTSPTTGEIRYAITSVETITFVTPAVVGTDYAFI